MGKVKSIFTMATLHLIKVLLDFSSKVLPVFIIAITLLKLAKVFELDWRLIIAVLVLEVILIIITIVFYSLFFKKDNTSSQTSNENTNVIEKPKKLPILNIAAVFFIFLGVIFIVLKLFKAVTWSWIWVLSPLWLSTALTVSILIICVIVSIISAVSKKNKQKNINSELDNNNAEESSNTENNNSIEKSDNNDDAQTKTENNNQENNNN